MTILIVAISLALVVSLLFYFSNKFIPIITGFASKIMGSGIYNSGRSLEHIKNHEFSKLKFISWKVDLENQKVVASVSGIFKRETSYNETLGCQLINSDKTYSINAPTIIHKQEIPVEINSRLQRAIEKHFEERSPKNPMNTRSIIVAHEGKIKAEAYAEGFHKEIPQAGWSIAKSIMNAFTGIYAAEKSVDIFETVPSSILRNKAHNYSIHQLLRMETGLDFSDYKNKLALIQMLFNSSDVFDYAQKFEQKSMENFTWKYSSIHSNILSGILRAGFKNHQDYLRFPYDRIFQKIGMSDTYFEVDSSGNFVGSSFIYATPRDYTKFGLLYLNNGVWKGEQVLPKGWVEYSHSPSQIDPSGQYGAHFWRNAHYKLDGKLRYWPDLPKDMYYASGYQGQNIVIIPSEKLVVVRLGMTIQSESWNIGQLVKDVMDNLGSNN